MAGRRGSKDFYRRMAEINGAPSIGITFLCDVIEAHQRRVMAARKAGGVPAQDVINKTKVIPAGWQLDVATNYFLPPDFSFQKSMN